ncbi:hypothetical protein [Paraburkholderia youngii]|uniref:hypothetical protein n=1 Tax=Paraburkholderia youngii TaxID=2782701 RepID=UPI003D1A75F3
MNLQHKQQATAALDAARVIAIMEGHGQTVRESQIGFYPTPEALAEKVRSSRNWSAGETFACDLSDGRYVIMRQVAPASCEMVTVSHNGFHDVLTAYRFSQDELVRQIQEYCGLPQQSPQANALPAIGAPVTVKIIDGSIVKGFVTAHDIKDGEPVFELQFIIGDDVGAEFSGTKWARPEQIVAAVNDEVAPADPGSVRAAISSDFWPDLNTEIAGIEANSVVGEAVVARC